MSVSENTDGGISKEQDENTSAEVVETQRTVDGITYTILSRSSENAAQTLQIKLEAMIGREITKLSFH